MSDAPHLVIGTAAQMQLAVTRLRSDAAPPAATLPIPCEPAFMVSLQLRHNADHELWLNGKREFRGAYRQNTVSVVDLRHNPIARPRNAFDFISFYVTQSSLDNVSREHDGHAITSLNWPRGTEDPILAALGRSLIPALEERSDPGSPTVQHIGLAIRIHIAWAYGGLDAARLVTAGGLAGWQERRAKEYIRENFATSLSISDIARECGLSPSHFTRAFRKSTGMQPHRWLTHHRVETAKAQLLESKMTVAEIGICCGFGDPSNFARVFSSVVGLSPSLWQRMHR
ncbi:AraC family transcriptional regulator [Ancylobacter sp. Lp-2]|uniref:helix-turn-helix domain-containing protein n=1 Tax=Ancylobacter sp. Lp-2 TaxID=2881339 RepID=UPI001E3C56D4|nr:AraC family transcriptional regulator [Ancylobacter sp. Lp-2]MCB4767666.1 AraC family transcriptional regulator [Ancylobacter sp. Lp-2]